MAYQVPAEIKHPSWLPLVKALRYPLPEKVPLPPVGLDPPLVVVVMRVVVVVGVEPPDFGRYLIPVEEQLEVEPTGEVGINVPVWIEPRTSKEYQTSSSAPDAHWIVT